VRPDAGFARVRDLRRLLVGHAETGRLTLGRVGRRLVACEPQTSLAVVGPTGCGKTAGFAIPALLEWDGPIIATSVKADLIQATIRHRQQAGSVWVYDPTGCSAHDGCSWSPLAACDTWAGAMRTAAWINEAGQPRFDTLSDADYWYSQSRKGLAPYLYAAGTSGGTMRDVVRWVDSQEIDEVQQILRTTLNVAPEVERYISSKAGRKRRQEVENEIRPTTIKAIRRSLKGSGRGRAVAYADQPVSAWPIAKQEQLDERVRIEVDKQMRAELTNELQSELRRSGTLEPLIAAQALWNKEPRLRGSVFATIENVLSGYADPTVCSAAEHCDIDFNEWRASDSTIYVVATAHEQARLRPVLTVLVQQAIRAAYDRAAASGGTLPKPCLVLLDEAGNTAPLRDLPGYAATARSHGITFVSIWQDLAQVKAIYHERAQTVINNHRAKLFGTGIADEATLEYVSRLVGDEPRTDRNLSADLYGGRRTLSEHTSYRRVAPVDVVRRIRPNEGVLLYGSELPVHIRLRPWHLDAELRRRSTVDAEFEA
jgi:type IV secretion system protein VirD4